MQIARDMSRNSAWRQAPACVGVSVVLLLQWLLVAIPTIDTTEFDRWAVELERSSAWRYGYVQQYHGAVLIKAPLTAEAASLVQPVSNTRSTIMARELRTGPWKAGLELVFYAVLFALVHLVLPRPPWAGAVAGHRLRWSLGVALSSALLVTAAMAPYLATGYGEPLFSTYRGPGALSYSGLVPITARVVPAVSYGLLLEWVLIWPLLLTQWLAEPLSAWLGIRGSLWIVSAGFWGVVIATGAWFTFLAARVKEHE